MQQGAVRQQISNQAVAALTGQIEVQLRGRFTNSRLDRGADTCRAVDQSRDGGWTDLRERRHGLKSVLRFHRPDMKSLSDGMLSPMRAGKQCDGAGAGQSQAEG